MYKGVKFRIYPNKEQRILMEKTFGCCRFVYNKALALIQETYKNDGKNLSYNQISAMLTQWKKQEEFAFLNEVPDAALRISLRNLDRAYQNFFKKRSRYPRFKSKHEHTQTFGLQNCNNSLRIEGKHILLPKLGHVKVRQTMEVDKIINAKVLKTTSDHYYVCLTVEFEPKKYEHNGQSIGLKMGIESFYTDSNGDRADNPKYLKKSMRKLQREQRRLSRKKLRSRNYEKQRVRLAKVHEKIRNQRNDFLQKQSTMLIRENQTICIEDLKVSDMIQSNKNNKGHISRELNRSLLDARWSGFFAMLEYKALWYDGHVVRIPLDEPVDRTCNLCGYLNPLDIEVHIHHWECPECQTVHNSHKNAAKNILMKGLSIQQEIA